MNNYDRIFYDIQGSKILLFLMLIFSIVYNVHAQSELRIAASASSNGKLAKLELHYSNESNDTVAIWLQNWRIILLDDENDKFYGIPSTESLVNFFIVSNDTMKLNNKISNVEYRSTSIGYINQQCIKVLNPKDKFCIELSMADERVISLVESKQLRVSGFICQSIYSAISDVPNIQDFLYKKRLLKLSKVGIKDNLPSTTQSQIVGIKNTKNAIALNVFQGKFQSYMITKLKLKY